MKTRDDGTIRLSSYPYVNARVRAMRSRLLTENDYRKLQNMSVSEITEFLQQGDYTDEINELRTDHEGTELLELALKRHLAHTYSKLRRISPDEVQQLLDAYFRKLDIQNIKTVLRNKLRDRDENIDPLLNPPQSYSEDELEQLVNAPTASEVLEEVKLPGSNKTLADAVDDHEDLQEIERVLDTAHYRHMADVAHRIPEQGRLFSTFLKLELEIKNISLILRMLQQEVERSEIEDSLLDVPASISSVGYRQLLEAGGYDEAVDMLTETKIGQYIEQTDIAHVERALDRYKLRKGTLMLHQSPLSINPILGYMISKEAEIQNLRIILQAKKTGLGDDFIEENIIPEVRER